MDIEILQIKEIELNRMIMISIFKDRDAVTQMGKIVSSIWALKERSFSHKIVVEMQLWWRQEAEVGVTMKYLGGREFCD